jgi:hypothetical protein
MDLSWFAWLVTKPMIVFVVLLAQFVAVPLLLLIKP